MTCSGAFGPLAPSRSERLKSMGFADAIGVSEPFLRLETRSAGSPSLLVGARALVTMCFSGSQDHKMTAVSRLDPSRPDSTTMQPDRMEAYRSLLYQGMLMLRAYPSWPVWGLRILSWSAWRRAWHQALLRATIADWLHNLADFSTREFEGFSENAFWHEGNQLRQRFPELDQLKRYYDCNLVRIRTGSWPEPGVWPNTLQNTMRDLDDDHDDGTSLEFPFDKLNRDRSGREPESEPESEETALPET